MEYILWGIPPGHTDEQVLYTKATTPKQARLAKAALELRQGCTAVRIQTLNLSKNDVLRQFAKSVQVCGRPPVRSRQ